MAIPLNESRIIIRSDWLTGAAAPAARLLVGMLVLVWCVYKAGIKQLTQGGKEN